jgi:hypothetical protein
MMKELILSIVSGIISAVILQAFSGRSDSDSAPRQRGGYNAPPARSKGGFGRLLLSVVGGIGLAYAIAPFILRRRYRDFDGFDGLDSLASYAPMLVLTVFATMVVWAMLSTFTRR